MIQELKQCIRCEIAKTRTNVVCPKFEVPKYRGMVIAEVPSKKEDRSGLFSDTYWKTTEVLFRDFGYNLNDFYVTSVIKCYPNQNRYPTKEEIGNCSHFFSQEVALVKPKSVLYLGISGAREYIKVDNVVMNREYQTSFCEKVIVAENPKSLIENTNEYKIFKSIVRKFIGYCIS